jgi:hypothetical protein
LVNKFGIAHILASHISVGQILDPTKQVPRPNITNKMIVKRKRNLLVPF